MGYVLRWREKPGAPQQTQECASRDEALGLRDRLRAQGIKEVAVLPQAQMTASRRRRLQITDPEGRVWDAESEMFGVVGQLAVEVQALLRK